MASDYYKASAQERDSNIGYLIRRSAQLMTDHIEHVFRARGISFTQWLILKVLDVNGPLSLLELSGYIDLNPATVSRAVESLRALGFVGRERNCGDRRAVVLTLTKEGVAYVRKYSGVVLGELNWLLDGFSRNEADALIDLMQRVLVKLTESHEKRQASSEVRVRRRVL